MNRLGRIGNIDVDHRAYKSNRSACAVRIARPEKTVEQQALGIPIQMMSVEETRHQQCERNDKPQNASDKDQLLVQSWTSTAGFDDQAAGRPGSVMVVFAPLHIGLTMT